MNGAAKVWEQLLRVISRFPFEIFVWLVALVALKFFTHNVDEHFVICPLQRAGFDFCPGCGLGRSMAYALDGYFIAAWQMHPLGIFAVIVILYRIIQLTLKYKILYGQNYRNPSRAHR